MPGLGRMIESCGPSAENWEAQAETTLHLEGIRQAVAWASKALSPLE